MFSNSVYDNFLIANGQKINPNVRKLIKKFNQVDNVNALIAAAGFSDINTISTINLVQVLWQDFHNSTNNNTCKMCSKNVKFTGWLTGWNTYCSSSCQMLDPNQQNIRREDAQRRFGVNNYLQKEQSVLKAKLTKSTAEYKSKFKESINASFADSGKKAIRIEKMLASKIRSGKKPWTVANKKVLDRLAELEFEIVSVAASGKPNLLKHSCGTVQAYGRWSGKNYLCTACNANNRIKAETGFINLIEEQLAVVIQRNVYHGPYKFDGKIGNVVIEHNGLFWHSNAAAAAGLGKAISPNYHYDKFKYCEENGLKLIQIFEDEIKFNLDIVLMRIKNALGLLPRIFARKCNIVEITNTEAKSFLTMFHSNKHVPCSKAFALKYEGEVVAVASFGKTRFGKRDRIELLRFATSGLSVVGGLSRLLSYAVKILQEDILTYSDNFWGNGSGYKAAGALLEKEVLPGYFYFDKKNFGRVSRHAFQRQSFNKAFGQEWDTCLSEEENAAKVNCFRVYDAGKKRWLFKKK